MTTPPGHLAEDPPCLTAPSHDPRQLGCTVSLQPGADTLARAAAASLRPIGIPAAAMVRAEDRLTIPDDSARLVRGTSAGQGRWSVGALIGRGATARVFSVTDGNLQREVAVKVLDEADVADDLSRNRFLSEARIAASLQHPGVIPIHELGADGDGRIFYAMKKVEGRSMAEEFDRPGRGRLGSINAVVSVFINLCGALAYAHHHRIVHQDVKPENIMLGDFGEVLLVDWGSAEALDPSGRITAHLYGTPLYMSPEQAAREFADPRSDIYCLGGTLLHALTGRVPVWRDAADAFWEAKRRGEIDPLTADELTTIPRGLTAILLTALAADPAQRFSTAREMLEDLERFQAGQAVRVARESWWLRLQRWYRGNTKLAWMSAAAVAGAGAVALMALHQQALESSSWREIYHSDRSSSEPARLDADWRTSQRTDWSSPGIPLPTATILHSVGADGSLAFTARAITDIGFLHPVLGDLRVEFLYRVTDKAENLNCFIGGIDRDHAYVIHLGGWGDPRRYLLTRGADGPVLGDHHDPHGVLRDHDYRVVVQKEGSRIRYWLDDRLLFDFHDFADVGDTGASSFGFDGCDYNTYEIRSLTLASRPLAQRISPVAVGDELMRLGHYREAASRYQELAEAYAGSELGGTALLRQAQAMIRDKDAGAETLLDTVVRQYPDHPLVPVALYERWHCARLAHDGPQANRLESELSRFPGHPILCSLLQDLVGDYLAEYERPGTRPGEYRAIHDFDVVMKQHYQHFRQLEEGFGIDVGNPTFEQATSDAQCLMGHPEAVLDLLQVGDVQTMEALVETGRYSELLRNYPEANWRKSVALFEMGRDEDILSDGYDGWLAWQVHLERGEGDQALALATNDLQRAEVQMAMGRYEEASHNPLVREQALWQLGRIDELIATADPAWAAVGRAARGQFPDAADPPTSDITTRYLITLMRLIAHDDTGADADLAALADCQVGYKGRDLEFAHYILRPVLDVLRGRSGNLHSRLQRVLLERRWTNAQTVYHLAAFLAGDIDASTFLAQPYHRFLPARLAFAQGLRADCQGAAPAALEAYRCYLATPSWSRPGHLVEEQFARWRVAVLSLR